MTLTSLGAVQSNIHPGPNLSGQVTRMWMSTAGMPKNIGDSLVSTISKVAETTKGMTADQLDQYGYREYEKLQRVHGAKPDERLSQAAVMIDDLEQQRPGLKNLLKSRGIGDNALIVNMLIQHATIYHARRGH